MKPEFFSIDAGLTFPNISKMSGKHSCNYTRNMLSQKDRHINR